MVVLTAILVLFGVLFLIPATRDLVIWVFNFLKDLYQHFIEVSPKAVKVWVFLFLLVYLASTVTSFFLGLLFFCDNTIVYEADDIITGTSIMIGGLLDDESEYGNLSTAEYNSIVENNSALYDTPDYFSTEAVALVQCRNDEPRLTTFGIPLFDFTTWIFILLVASVGWLYYHKNK